MNQEKNRNGIERGKNTRIKREKLQLFAKRPITRTPEQYKKMSKILDVRIWGRQRRPNECVCKEKVLLHKNNVKKNNMITELKDNKIINIKNKAMNNI